ncbi:MAG: DegT/DnrJ/EryC1/StrS family aminotransferase [Lachnospiraceae bacterium]|nr:DegT/DnrJ/EryC1/StrS family aminotransferase [Lachnospiraceae bacterium]
MENRIFVTKSFMPPYEKYIEAIKPLWDTHWITNMGIYHNELETRLKSYLKVKELSLMVNGHMALELAIQAYGFKEGSEIITTPFTFISTTHAIVRNGLTPVFCDVKLEDGTIDENKIEELITDKTVAIVPVHVYGNLCNVEVIENVAKKHDLKVIYDAAHAFGIEKGDIGVGNYGDVSVFSFHATKVFNTIEGGAVVCAERSMYDRLYNLKNFGIRGEELVEEVGANAKMNEFSAIMGLCNLDYIDEVINKRKERYRLYIKHLKKIKGIRVLNTILPNERFNYAYLPIVVEEEYGISRDELSVYLRKNNVYARKYFYPLTVEQECYKGVYSDDSLNNSRYLSNRVLVLPLYAELQEDLICEICDLIKSAKTSEL